MGWGMALFFSLFSFSACVTTPSRQSPEKLDNAQELHEEGKKLFQSGKPTEALDLLGRSLAICEEQGHKICIADNLNAMGLIYMAIHETEKALDALKRALPVNQEAKNWFAVAAILNSLGKIENDRGRDAEALRYFNQSLEVSLKLKYPVGLGTTFNNIGKIYYHRKDYAQALQYYNRALEFFVAGGDRERARVVMGNIQLTENHLSGEKSADPATQEKPPEEITAAPPMDLHKKEEPARPGTVGEEKARVLLGSGGKETPKEITIKKDRLNLYASPSTASTVKGKVLMGGAYPVLDRFQGAGPEEVFFKIQLNNGKIGWIYDPENNGNF